MVLRIKEKMVIGTRSLGIFKKKIIKMIKIINFYLYNYNSKLTKLLY
jgi:hypothetical protein